MIRCLKDGYLYHSFFSWNDAEKTLNQNEQKKKQMLFF